MMTVHGEADRKTNNFWNHCLFHPTDAVEDPWGKRILDRMAKDGSIKGVRIYAMLEDIVYRDEEDRLQYDFRLSDLRLDYLLQKGFTPLIAYAGMPDCISNHTQEAQSNSKNKTRYKGKLFNTNLPSDFALWEEVCYQYTLHNIERYGIEEVREWRFTCFNEPDASGFFLSSVPNDDVKTRVESYADLYAAFERGVRRASKHLKIGDYAIMLTYANEDFDEDLPAIEETLVLPEDAVGKKLTLYLIDRTHTNPYRLAERNGISAHPTKEEIDLLRREGTLSPVAEYTLIEGQISLHLEANATVLMTVEA